MNLTPERHRNPNHRGRLPWYMQGNGNQAGLLQRYELLKAVWPGTEAIAACLGTDNIIDIARHSDQSVLVKFPSTRSASYFEFQLKDLKS